ncbi:MAG: SIMPL domain-containing protein [Burkholderiales bacterium]|nr:SIMPL domain-containing protein [Burkholderiales bacterium]
MRFLLLLSALCCAVPAAQAQPPSVATPAPLRYNVVELQVDAQREVGNDLMAATLYVEDNHANPATLAGNLNRALAEAVRLAREQPAVRVRTGNNATYPVYAPRTNQLQGWRGRAEVRLETRDFAAGSALIGRLQATMQLAGVAFSVSPEARKAAENELVAEAIAAFRQRAEIVQKAMAGRGYKIQRVALGSSGPPPPRMMMAARAAIAEAAVPAPPAEGGVTMLTVTASGAIEIE